MDYQNFLCLGIMLCVIERLQCTERAAPFWWGLLWAPFLSHCLLLCESPLVVPVPDFTADVQFELYVVSYLQSHAVKTAVVLELCNLTKPGIKQERSRKKKLLETRSPEIPKSIGFIPSLTFLKINCGFFLFKKSQNHQNIRLEVTSKIINSNPALTSTKPWRRVTHPVFS